MRSRPPARRGPAVAEQPPLSLPVPRATREALQAAGGVRACTNLSLAFNRFYDGWQPDFSDHDRQRARRFLDACQQVPDKPAARELLRAYQERQRALLESYQRDPWQAVALRARLRGRLVSGLGSPHPREAGLTLHRIGGFPYLPGSSLKGATRAAAEELQGGSTTYVELAFGSAAAEDSPAARGTVVFFDALPEPGYRLDLDVLTPHHADYYAGNNREFPTDWQSPNPVLFLAVARGAVFRFALATRRRDLAQGGLEARQAAGRRLDQALDWLRAALESGLGGKTSAGHGRFEVLP